MQFQRLDSFHPMTSLDGEPTTLNFKISFDFGSIMTAGPVRHGGNESTAGIRKNSISVDDRRRRGRGKKNQKPQNGADFVTSSPAVA